MTASHELRTPLTSMSMSLELLLESAADKLNEDERRLVQTAEEDVARLRALVNDLLDLSKIEAGRMPMEFDRVAADRLIGHVLSLFEEQARERTVELTSDFGESLPEIWADANKIAWVLTNLISNALRYSPAGGRIEITGHAIGRFVHFSVTDEGPGVPLEYQTKIFDKFVQVRDDQMRSGSGLGLAICREIVKAHGGTIWVDSVEGQGSRFTFTIPAADEPSSR
jgi:NtrC-family two-component system sensor histidine kinase KinB